jgi:RNA polymerase sigma-70 factor (ECF subfamily)
MLDTDDMVQESLLATFRRLEDFVPRGDGALDAYVRKVLHHRITDEMRKARRRPASEMVHSGKAGREASPLEQTIGRETAERYERALGRLTEREREAVVARVELGLDYGQIASALDRPTRDAARMAVSRALLRLAWEMDREG